MRISDEIRELLKLKPGTTLYRVTYQQLVTEVNSHAHALQWLNEMDLIPQDLQVLHVGAEVSASAITELFPLEVSEKLF